MVSHRHRREDRQVRWDTDVPGDPLGGVTVVNDLVFTALLDGKVVALDRSSATSSGSTTAAINVHAASDALSCRRPTAPTGRFPASAAEAVQAELPRLLRGEPLLRVLHETIADPAVHHGLLHERGGPARVGDGDRARFGRVGEELAQQS